MHSRKGKDTVENDKRFEIDTTSQHDEQTREGDESGGQDGRVGEVTELRGRVVIVYWGTVSSLSESQLLK